MKIYLLLLYSVLLINISSGQELIDLNLDFEEWDSTALYDNEIFDDIILEREPMVPLHWYCSDSNVIACSGYSKTSDSDKGASALVLSGFYQYEFMSISLGDSHTSGLPIDYKPKSLKGSYKAILLGTTCDSLEAYVDIYLTKYNFQDQVKDTIGEGHILLEETDNAYSNFVTDIIYYDDQIIPDSVSITLLKRRFGFPANINECYECGHVYFDNLALPAISLSVNEKGRVVNEFECYPNPAIEHFTIKNNTTEPKFIHVFDVFGSIIFKGNIEYNSHIIIHPLNPNTNMLFVTDGRKTKKVLITN